MLKQFGPPLAIGAGAGFGLAKIFRPSDIDIGNLQKKELLTHYDSAISELERRIAAKHGEGALSKIGGTPVRSLAEVRAVPKPEYNLAKLRAAQPKKPVKSMAESRPVKP
jgi:hypothetical protein